MSDNRHLYCGLLVLCLGISQLAGCCCQNPCAGRASEMSCRPRCQGYQMVAPACFGYHSTCWSPWPVDCKACPPPLAYPATDDVSEAQEPSSALKDSNELGPSNLEPSSSPNSAQEKPQTEPETSEPGKDSSSQLPHSSEQPSAQPQPAEAKPAPPSDLERQQGQLRPTSNSEPIPAEFEARRVTFQKVMVAPVIVEAAQE